MLIIHFTYGLICIIIYLIIEIKTEREKQVKKILSTFLLCILVCVMLSSFVSAAEDVSSDKELKILAIGNSFSVDAMQYLYDVANDGGYRFTLGNLYIGGCSLDTHANNIANDSAAYTYYKNTSGEWTNTASTSVATAIADEEWDIITVQQASHYSGVASSYSKLPNILDYIEENAPSAKVYFHMTWAYQQNSTHSGFANYNGDQMTMYNAILSAVDSKVKTEDRILGIIPSGTAVQNLRSSYVGDTVTRDGYHMSYDYGRYTTALTWYAFFTGEDVSAIDWVPQSYEALLTKNNEVVRESVKAAIANPFEVTKITVKEPGKLTDAEIFESFGLNIAAYKKMDWVLEVEAYYNSASTTIPFDLISHANSTASNLKNFIASHRFTRETLPVGSVIIVDEGYRYRPERWIDENYVATSSNRPTNSTENTVVTDEWWGEYGYRAFNLSATQTKTMTAQDAAHMRIYVPLYPDVTLVNHADTNGDGSVNVHDVIVTLKTIVERSGTASDMNGDGIANLLDAILLIKEIVAK